MFSTERRRLIVELVLRDGAISLKDLASAARTSEVTVRRDLRQLEQEGQLERRHGGAVAPTNGPREPTYTEKRRVAEHEKNSIASAAAALVADGDAILIGAGTTTQAFARRLIGRKDLAVVTNSLLVATVLASAPGVDVTVTGGSLRGTTYAFVGPAAEQSLATLHAGRVFLSGNGLTASRGLSTPNATVASMDRALVTAAAEVVVLADHTKIGRNAMVQTVPPERITRLVTDALSDGVELAGLRAAGVEISTVAL